MDECVWYIFKLGYRTTCNHEISRKPINFKYCPFCGKLIKVPKYKCKSAIMRREK